MNTKSPARWFIVMLFIGAAVAFWLIIMGGEPLWR